MTGNLATLLFGTHRRDALALLLLHPEDALHVREIGRITGTRIESSAVIPSRAGASPARRRGRSCAS